MTRDSRIGPGPAFAPDSGKGTAASNKKSEKTRIYQIAKEHSVSSDAMLQVVRGFGVEVKSHMSSIDEAPAIRDSGIPIYKWLEWYDQNVTQQAIGYENFKQGGRHKMTVGPWTHGGGVGSTVHMAEVLRLIGYTNIVGIDASDGMLAAAEAKGCYVELHNLLLGAEIDLPA